MNLTEAQWHTIFDYAFSLLLTLLGVLVLWLIGVGWWIIVLYAHHTAFTVGRKLK